MSGVGMYVQETVIGKLKQHSVSQHEDWVAARFKFGVDKITFWQNANGNFEIWFNTSKDNICLTFSRDMVGVYDANTRTGKSVHLSQHSVSQISNRVLLWSGTAGKGVKITIDSDYSFKEFKSFYCLTSIDKTIGLPLVRNSGIQQDQHLHGITGWDDGNTTYTLVGLIRINTETTATITSISKHDIGGNGGIAGSLLKLWGYY